MKPRLLSTARLSFPLASAIAALVTASSTQAASIYWDGISASWNLNTNWSTASGADTPDPGAVPGAADDAIFNISTVNGAETITLDANQAVNSMTFNNTGTTALTGGGTARTLTLGTGGITVASGAGAVTLGSGTAGNNVLLNLSGAQTWTNNTANAFTINNTAATFTRQTGATLTFEQGQHRQFRHFHHRRAAREHHYRSLGLFWHRCRPEIRRQRCHRHRFDRHDCHRYEHDRRHHEL